MTKSRGRKGHDTRTTHKTVIHTDPYFISFADLLLLITQISLAAFKVIFHIFNTHLLRAAGVFALIHGLGRAFIRCCKTLHKRCCLRSPCQHETGDGRSLQVKGSCDFAQSSHDEKLIHTCQRRDDTANKAKPSFKEGEST